MNAFDIPALLSSCSAGDKQAIEQFFAAYHPHVFRMALSILDDPDEADEAAQDALLQALKGLQSYRPEGKLTSWLYTITLNVCRGRLRKRRTRERLKQILTGLFRLDRPENSHPEEQAIYSEKEGNVWRAVHALPEKLRTTITLRYYHDLSISEIAQILQVSERAVHYRLREAHERLRVLLEERVLGE